MLIRKKAKKEKDLLLCLFGYIYLILFRHKLKHQLNKLQIVVYGHNMRDNSMFGSLKDVITE